MSTTSKVLAALLVVQLLLIGTRAARSGTGAGTGTSATEGVPVLGGITAGQVARMRIVDAQGEKIELARTSDGWGIATAGDYPAKAENVNKVLDRLLGMRPVGVAGTARATHAGLEVAEGNAQRDVTLLAADGKELARVFLGKTFGGGAFVRRAGSDEVLRISDSLTWEVSTAPGQYVDTQLVSFDQAQATAITIGKGAATIALEKGEGDVWKLKKPVEMDAAKDKVDQYLSSTARQWFTRPVAAKAAPEHGLEPPALALEMKLKDGTVHKVEVGASVGDRSGRYARKGGSPYVVELPEHIVTGIDKDVEFFKPAPPPAATPAAPGAPGAPPIHAPPVAPPPPGK